MHASYLTHARWVAQAQSGSCGVLCANIRRRVDICGPISADVLDLLTNISTLARICGQISVDVRISVGQYQQTCEDLLRTNISTHANIFWQISEDVRRSVGKYQKICEELLANINRCAKIYFEKISADANIRRCA